MHPSVAGPIHPVIMVSTDSTGQAFRFIENIPMVGMGVISTGSTFSTIPLINYKPSVVATPYTYQIVEENVPYHYPWGKIGFNPDVGAAEEDCWWLGGTYVFPATSGIQMRVVSDNNLDAQGSSGVNSVHITYLDSNYLETSTIVLMNGTTAVNTVATNIARVNYLRVYTAGTNGSAIGTIRIQNTGGTVSYSAIAPTQTRAPQYTVPSGKRLYITSIFFGAAGEGKTGNPTRMVMRTNCSPITGICSSNIFWPVSEVLIRDSPIFGDFAMPSMINEKADLKVSAVISAASSGNQVTATMRGWLEDI